VRIRLFSHGPDAPSCAPGGDVEVQEFPEVVLEGGILGGEGDKPVAALEGVDGAGLCFFEFGVAGCELGGEVGEGGG
jgi:hypothetical protein